MTWTKRSNCLIFAIQRLCDEGYGGIWFRKSRFGWWPHFFYVKELPPNVQIDAFVPFEHVDWEALPRWKRVLPVHIAVFRGKVEHDDRRKGDRRKADRRNQEQGQ